jgi:hypothetical protein
MPHLPATPQAVAIWLSEEFEHGLDHLARLRDAVATAHRAADFKDPTEDMLVRAILRLASKVKNQTGGRAAN